MAPQDNEDLPSRPTPLSAHGQVLRRLKDFLLAVMFIKGPEL